MLIALNLITLASEPELVGNGRQEFKRTVSDSSNTLKGCLFSKDISRRDISKYTTQVLNFIKFIVRTDLKDSRDLWSSANVFQSFSLSRHRDFQDSVVVLTETIKTS